MFPNQQSTPAIPALPAEALSQFAFEWRAGFSKKVENRRQAGQSLDSEDYINRSQVARSWLAENFYAYHNFSAFCESVLGWS